MADCCRKRHQGTHEEFLERERERSRQWYYANREKSIARATLWAKEHPERARASRRRYYDTHPESRSGPTRSPEAKAREKARRLERLQDPEYRAAYNAKARALKKLRHAWRMENDPEYVRKRRAKRAASRKRRRQFDPLDHHLRRRYGMRRSDYEAMVALQGGRCAMCGDIPTRRLDVDHDHETGVVRQLLCSPCNRGLGMFRDDPARLQAGIDYLLRHQRAA